MNNLALKQDNDEYQEALQEAFPNVRCPIKPLGNRVLVQIRLPKSKTKSGLILGADTEENILRNEQTAKVISISPSAFKFPTTGESYLDSSTFAEGEYVRVPLHGGDNHWIIEKNDKGDDIRVLFKTFKDYEVIGIIQGNPLEVKTHMAYF